MRIWIFEPSPVWEYTGGMLIAIAPTFERAVELGQNCEPEEKHRLFRSVADIPGIRAQAWTSAGFFDVDPLDPRAEYFCVDAGWYTWVLKHDFEVDNALEERAWCNYNYA